MSDLVRVEPVALLPTPAGCAVFLSDGQKVIVFYIDPAIGASINAVLSETSSLRPLSHDLFSQVLEAFGAEVLHATIVRYEGEVFYARLVIKAENELMEKKIVELDARPSDCLALALRDEAPVFVVQEVWDSLEDMNETLESLRNQDDAPGGFGV